jgi:pyridoxal/pyridoxine/pyridoxamine kinase
LGDERRLYVPEEMIGIYRDEIIPYADMIFPNQTEAEYVIFNAFFNILFAESISSNALTDF